MNNDHLRTKMKVEKSAADRKKFEELSAKP